jgi:ribosomal protein S18 acetylase RimI-like enzyme
MQIRAMTENDIDDVVNVIDTHDDDDAEDARHDFEKFGVSDQWVVEVEGSVVGTSGFRRVPETDGTGWISWTYVDAERCGHGIGRGLFKHVLDQISNDGGNKIFIKVSNYQDEDGEKTYLAATKMYESFGFARVLVSKDFYDSGEDQYIYSKDLRPVDIEDELKAEEKPAIRFVDIFEIGETDGAYSFTWQVINKPLFQQRSFSADDLTVGLKAVKESGGRIVFLTFPCNLPLIHSPLSDAGFKFVGQLTDYYERGVHEMHFVHRLDGI